MSSLEPALLRGPRYTRDGKGPNDLSVKSDRVLERLQTGAGIERRQYGRWNGMARTRDYRWRITAAQSSTTAIGRNPRRVRGRLIRNRLPSVLGMKLFRALISAPRVVRSK